MLKRFIDWRIEQELAEEDEEKQQEENEIAPSIPELDSYTYVRASTWWAVLARDNWTCCSCRRSSKDEGIILEVPYHSSF